MINLEIKIKDERVLFNVSCLANDESVRAKRYMNIDTLSIFFRRRK